MKKTRADKAPDLQNLRISRQARRPARVAHATAGVFIDTDSFFSEAPSRKEGPHCLDAVGARTWRAPALEGVGHVEDQATLPPSVSETARR
jgi:hypothetical protein